MELAKQSRRLKLSIAKIQAYDPATYETVKALIDLPAVLLVIMKSLTYDQFLAMRDSVLSIWDLSKEIKEIQIDGKKVSVETAVADLNARLSELDKGGDIPGKDRAITDKEKRSMANSKPYQYCDSSGTLGLCNG